VAVGSDTRQKGPAGVETDRALRLATVAGTAADTDRAGTPADDGNEEPPTSVEVRGSSTCC